MQSLAFDEGMVLIRDGAYDAIVFHTLFADYYPLVLSVPEGKPVIWISWGADIYYDRKGSRALPLYKPLTKEFLYGRVSLLKRLKRFVKRFIPTGKDQRARDKVQKKAISRVDFCSTIIRSEFERLDRLSFFKAKYFPFSYVGKKKKVIPHFDSGASSILINNSADLSGNHLDILDCLGKKGITNPKVIPISYGRDRMRIKSALTPFINADSDLLLENFMGIQEYCDVLHHCRAAVFGHIRQQALGNIELCLKAGMKVFLYKDSLMYKHCVEMGIKIFSIEEDLTKRNVDEPLSENEINENCRILHELYDYDGVVSRVKGALETL